MAEAPEAGVAGGAPPPAWGAAAGADGEQDERGGGIDASGSEAPVRQPMDATRSIGARAAEAIGSTVVVSPRPAAGAPPDALPGSMKRETGAEDRAAGERGTAVEPARFLERGELGRGGMGRVMLAHDRRLERPVAIKQALSDDAAHQLRFAREVRITARLEHPGIVPVHDAGYDGEGHPYYVMRRLEGRPLEELVRATASAAERLALVPHVLAAADAAAYAHAQGIIHRDIKPSNVLVGRYGETWLIDWGLAREVGPDADADPVSDADADADPDPDPDPDPVADPDPDPDPVADPDPDPDPGRRAGTPRMPVGAGDGLTRAGDVVGTPGFVAPEQARGEPVGVRADVYSLGATLVYALTGQLVYPERTPTRLLEQAARDAPIRLPAQTRELPSALLAIVARATAARPADRYRSAADLASDLRRFLTGQLVAAHRYSRGERLRRFLRKHRAAVAIAAIAVAALGITGALSIHRVLDERDRASAAERRAQLQRDLAEQRSEQLLLERARVLAPTHPTAALATLKLLPPGSDVWPAAWGIAAQAMASGVSFGLAGHRRDAYALAFSPDGKWLASGGDDGALQLHELATRRSRVLAREPERIAELVWLDADRLLYASGGALISVAAGTGASARRTVAASQLHVLAGGAVRYVSGGAVWQLDRQPGRQPGDPLAGEPRRLLAPVHDLIGSPLGTAVTTGEELVWIAGDGAVTRLGPYREKFLIGAVDGEARRLAISTLREVHELDLTRAPAELLHRLPLEKIMAIAYSPAGLCLSTPRRSWISTISMHPSPAPPVPATPVPPSSPVTPAAPATQRTLSDELPHAAQLRLLAPNPRGCTFIEQTGRATVVHDRRRIAVPVRGAPVITAAASPRGAVFAVSHAGGGLEVWPMPALPQLIPLDLQTLSMVGHSERSLYFYDFDTLLQVSRATGAITPLPGARWSSALIVEELDDRHLLAYDLGNRKLAIFDLAARRQLHALDGVTALSSTDRGGGVQLIARGRQLAFFEPASGRVAPLIALDEPIVSLAQLGDLALARSAATTWRIELARGAARSMPIGVGLPAVIDRAGVCWLATGEPSGGLVRWDGATSRTIAMPAELTQLVAHRWLGTLALDRTGKVHVLGPEGELVRTVAAAPSTTLSPDRPYAVWMHPEREAVVLGDLVGGEHIALPIGRSPATALAVDSGGAVIVTNLLEREAMIFPPLLPHRAGELAAWLPTATNAEIAIDSPEPRWNLAPASATKGVASP